MTSVARTKASQRFDKNAPFIVVREVKLDGRTWPVGTRFLFKDVGFPLPLRKVRTLFEAGKVRHYFSGEAVNDDVADIGVDSANVTTETQNATAITTVLPQVGGYQGWEDIVTTFTNMASGELRDWLKANALTIPVKRSHCLASALRYMNVPSDVIAAVLKAEVQQARIGSSDNEQRLSLPEGDDKEGYAAAPESDLQGKKQLIKEIG